MKLPVSALVLLVALLSQQHVHVRAAETESESESATYSAAELAAHNALVQRMLQQVAAGPNAQQCALYGCAMVNNVCDAACLKAAVRKPAVPASESENDDEPVTLQRTPSDDDADANVEITEPTLTAKIKKEQATGKPYVEPKFRQQFEEGLKTARATRRGAAKAAKKALQPVVVADPKQSRRFWLPAEIVSRASDSEEGEDESESEDEGEDEGGDAPSSFVQAFAAAGLGMRATHNVGWAGQTAAPAITYSWEIERGVANNQGVVQPNGAEARFLLFFFRPACWRAAEAADWAALSHAQRTGVHNAVWRATRGNGNAAGNAINLLNTIPNGPRGHAVADCAHSIDNDVPVNGFYDFEHYVLNRDGGNVLRVGDWAALNLPNLDQKLPAPFHAWFFGVAGGTTRQEGLTALMLKTNPHLHQEVGANTYEFMTQGHITNRKHLRLHLSVIHNVMAEDCHSHSVFQLPHPFNGGNGANVAVRGQLAALAAYLNDYGTIIGFAIDMGASDLCHSFLGPMPTTVQQFAHTQLTTRAAPTHNNGGYEWNVNGANVGSAKFLFVGFRSGPYGADDAQGRHRMGFEFRFTPGGGANRSPIMTNVIDTLHAMDGVTAGVSIELPGWFKRRLTDLTASNPQGNFGNHASRVADAAGFTNFGARLTAHAVPNAVNLNNQFNGDLAAFNLILSRATAEAANHAAYHPHNDANVNLAQACSFRRIGLRMWMPVAGTCANWLTQLKARMSLCYHSGLEAMDIYAGNTAKHAIVANLRAHLAALENIFHTGVTWLTNNLPNRPALNAGEMQHRNWGLNVFDEVHTRIVVAACTETRNYLADRTNWDA